MMKATTPKEGKQMKNRNLLVWIATVIFSILFIAAGNRIVSKGLQIFQQVDDGAAIKAEVIRVKDRIAKRYDMGGGSYFENLTLLFDCRVLSGGQAGKTVTGYQSFYEMTEGMADVKEVEAGDRIIMYNYPDSNTGAEWTFGEYVRFDVILWLGILFFLLLLFFGRFKGLNTIISLGFTCLAVFFVFVPSVLNGCNIYLTSSIVCVFTIIMTLLIVNGASEKTLATILGCLFGVALAALLTVIMDKFLALSGLVDDQSIYLQMLNPDKPIDLKAVVFGSIIIGAMGAVMDVAMDIASSLHEITRHVEDISFGKLFKSGMNIGSDVMGTMANTLVLAYIGSSLSSALLLITYSTSFMELLNREQIIVEFLQALVGSTAILLTIPLTAFICGVLYTRKKRRATNRPSA